MKSQFKTVLIILTIGVLITLGFVFPSKTQTQELEGITIPTLDKPVSEMTIEELQAKIIEITQAVQQLQALLLQLIGAPDVSRIHQDFTFQNNLKYGQSSIDVKYLQIFLNSDPDTQLAISGAGSSGNETNYFGKRTLQAVMKFQEKYANEVLAPWGLTRGTGFVGKTTQAKINEILAELRSIGEEEEEEEALGYCGDGLIQQPNSEGIHEICDTDNLNNQTCQTRGYTSGTLSCSEDCLTFNTTKCYRAGGGKGGTPPSPELEPEPQPTCGDIDGICPSGCTHSRDTDCTYCGDNIIQTPDDEGISEVCDGTDLGGQTCQSRFGSGWSGNLSCSTDCLTFVTDDCIPSPPPTQAPTLNPIGNKTTNENQELSFKISATDPDGDELSFSVSNRPAGATFQDQTFTWTPTYEQAGTYNLTFTVSDGSLTDTGTITITVYNVNRAPVLDSIGNKSVDENQELSFQVSATDPDGNNLSYSIQNKPSGATFSNRTFTWTPSYTQSGTYNLTFTVSDQEYTDQETITITVNDVCVPDTCSSLGYECGSHSDGCGGTLNCGTCNSGYTCESGQCVAAAVCGDSTCNGDETCSTCPQDCGTCPVLNTYYVSPSGGGAHDGFAAEDAFSLSEAQAYANANLNQEITFLLSSGDYGELLDEITERTAWLTWKADDGHTPIFSKIRLGRWDGPYDKYLHFEGITIQTLVPLVAQDSLVHVITANHIKFINCNFIGAGYSDEERSSGLNLRHSNYIEVKGCKVYGTGLEPRRAFEYGISSRASHNVIIEDCDITKCGVGIIAWGRNWTVRNCELHQLNSDGIIGSAVADTVFENNRIYDIIIPSETTFHADAIQLYNPGGIYPGSSEYVYTENVTIRGNTMYNSSGQIMLWNGFIPEADGGPPSRNIIVEDNLMYASDAHEVHVSETEGLTFVNNTVIGNAIFRGGIKDLHVENNIATLMDFSFSEGATVTYEDYNLVNQWGNGMTDFVQGDHTIALENKQEFDSLFVDPDINDFTLKQGLIIGEPPNAVDPCFMSSTGSYVGSEQCIGCEDNNPIAIFTVNKTYGYEPLEVQFDASYSLACNTGINSYNWSFGDTTTAEGQTVTHTYSAGSYLASLTVTNSLGNSNSIEKMITVLPSAVPNLVLYLNFDGSVLDFSGKNNHGEWQGSESYALGIEDQAISLNGTADGTYVLVGHDETLDGMGKLTLSAWAKKNSADVGGSIFLKHVTYHIDIRSNQVYNYLFNSSGDRLDLIVNSDSIYDTEWHHYVVTYDGAAVRLYIDGQEAGSQPFSGDIAVQPSRNLYIGKNSWDNSFNGLIDEVKIYDRDLSQSEIQDIYNTQKPSPTAMISPTDTNY